MKLRLMLPKDLPDTAFPKISPHCGRIGFPANRDPDHGLIPERCFSFVVPHPDPQVKKIPSSEFSSLDEMLEGRLPADPLVRAKPFR